MSAEHVRPEEEYYLLASASAQRRPQFLLNHAESFAIFDLGGVSDPDTVILNPEDSQYVKATYVHIWNTTREKK